MSELRGRVWDLVQALEVARCAAFKNIASGMDFIRDRPEWSDLTAPELREELMQFVDRVGGVERMNAWAREFYTAALDESARRASSP